MASSRLGICLMSREELNRNLRENLRHREMSEKLEATRIVDGAVADLQLFDARAADIHEV
jgi:hypothetical protein